MDSEVNVLAMVRGEERYVFLYDDKNRTETLRLLGRYAADPQLSFTWYDAAVMSKKIRQIAAEEEATQASRLAITNRRFSNLHEEDLL